MSSILTSATIACLFLIAFHYVGYPVFLYVLAKLRPRRVAVGEVRLAVTIVTAAYNEEDIIGRKLETTLQLDYPELEIIVVSDGSTDRTLEIARTYAPRGMRVLVVPERQGKAYALNLAVAQSNGEIILISDANAFPHTSAVRMLVRNFNDPQVGCVSGGVAPGSKGTSAVGSSEALYWRYENFIRSAESTIASSTGVVGSLLAIRRSLYVPIPSDVINDDSYLMLATLRQGYRSIYEPGAYCWRYASRSTADELLRKQRTAAGRYQHLLRLASWPWNMPLTAFCLFCHKFLRLVLPWLMLVAFVSNLALLAYPAMPKLLLLTLFAQTAFYGMAIVGFATEHTRLRGTMTMLAYYVVSGNIGLMLGLLRHLVGQQSVLWRKVAR